MQDRVTSLKGTSAPKHTETENFSGAGAFLTPDQADHNGFIFHGMERFLQRGLLAISVPHLRQSAENILVVAGKPGSGKTHAVTQGVLRNGWGLREVPPSTLASEHESGATKPLEHALGKAEEFSAHSKLRIAISMNDIELSILPSDDKGKVGRTVNTQLFNGFLQGFTEKPRRYLNYDGTPIVLIATTNDLTAMRSSLLRTARADIYEHAPTREERAAFADSIFKPRSLKERRRLNVLLTLFSSQPVSFWVALATAVEKGQLDELIDRGLTDPDEVGRELRRHIPVRFRQLYAIGRRLSAKRNRSYL